jgi:hypothetical protein
MGGAVTPGLAPRPYWFVCLCKTPRRPIILPLHRLHGLRRRFHGKPFLLFFFRCMARFVVLCKDHSPLKSLGKTWPVLWADFKSNR